MSKLSTSIKDQNWLESLEVAKKEWFMWTQMLGKVLILCGPASSGKTTLSSIIADQLDNIVRFKERKKILYNVEYTELFGKALLEASTICSSELSSTSDLLTFPTTQLPAVDQERFLRIREDVLAKLNSEEFTHYFLSRVFSEYFSEIKKYIYSGVNVIIDESFVNSEETLNIFKHSFSDYPHIRTVLLFNDMDDTLIKCQSRNKNFLIALNKTKNVTTFKQELQKAELDSGGSATTLRMPGTIIGDHTYFYNYQTSIAQKDTVLKSLTPTHIESSLRKIVTEQFKLLGLLTYYKYFLTFRLQDLISLEEIRDHFIQNTQDPVFITPTMKYDYVINLSLPGVSQEEALAKGLNSILEGLKIPYKQLSNKDLVPAFQQHYTLSQKVVRKMLQKKENDTSIIKFITSVADTEFDDVGRHLETYKHHKSATKKIVCSLLSYKVVFLSFAHDLQDQFMGVMYLLNDNKIRAFFLDVNEIPITDNEYFLLFLTNFYIAHTMQMGSYPLPEITDVTQHHNKDGFIHILNDIFQSYKSGFQEGQFATTDQFMVLECNPFKASVEYAMLLSEWNMWSRCFGKVLVINGASSSGKTTLSKVISHFGFIHISMDEVIDDIFSEYINNEFSVLLPYTKNFLTSGDILSIALRFKIDESKYGKHEMEIIQKLKKQINSAYNNIKINTLEIYDRLYEKAVGFIFSGQDVVLDVISEDISLLQHSFRSYPMVIGILYSTLEETLKKCFQRNYVALETGSSMEYRSLALVIAQYNFFYKFFSAENVSKLTPIIDVVSRPALENILEYASHCGRMALANLNKKLLEVPYNGVEYNDAMKYLDEAILELKMAIALQEDGQLVVTPTVKHDFIIKTSYLKDPSFTKKLISVIKSGYSKPVNIQEAVIDIAGNNLLPQESIQGFAHCLYDKAKVSGVKFLVYYKDMKTLPITVGECGPIVELECDERQQYIQVIGEDSKNCMVELLGYQGVVASVE
jgi:dephospho-CoA kinase